MPPKINIDKETLINLYIVEKKTLEEVCEIIGVKSPITLRKRMDEYGIKRRDPNKENSLIFNLGLTHEQFKKELERLYLEKLLSINEIAKKFDVSAVIIRRRLIEYGIPLRNHKESNKVSNSLHKNHKWKGGKKINQNGYVMVLKPEHPHAVGIGYVYEHRIVMEEHLGRILKTDEQVHHINEIKTDNRIENLQILSPSEHAKLHGTPRQRMKRKKKR